MNGTAAVYDPGQTAAIALAAPVVVPALSALVFALSQRHPVHGETSDSRNHYVYLVIAGNLLGIFIGKFLDTHPTATYGALYAHAFVALGFFLMHVARTVGRNWNYNPNVAMPSDVAFTGRSYNPVTHEDQHVLVHNDVTSDLVADEAFEVEGESKILRERQWMLGALLGLFVVIGFSDGLYLVARAPVGVGQVAAVVASYWANVASMSLAVYGAMLHAHFATTERTNNWRVKWWVALTLLWFALAFCTTAVPLLAQVQVALAAAILQHDAMIALFGAASGMLLYVCAYFYLFLFKYDVASGSGSRWAIAASAAVFAVAIAQAVVSSVFL